MKLRRAVALRISNLLVMKHMTQYELAKRMLVDQSTIRHIMHEDSKTITLTTLYKLADAFEMTVQEFMNDELFERKNIDDID